MPPAADKPRKKKKKLPEPLATQHTHVVCGPDKNTHTATVSSAGAYMSLGVDNSWDFDEFASQFQITINRLSDTDMEFDMVGVDPAVANALRRILIAEVPTVAIEHVFFVDNTSIIQDEVFAHRLGLVPLNVDPELLSDRRPEDAANETNTLVLKLAKTCTSRDGPDARVLSSDLVWLPGGSELPDETSTRFAASQDDLFAVRPAAVDPDILLAKLRPGQCIELEAHCVRGLGREHAKWSPVATAWYRLLPEVVLLQAVEGDLLRKLEEQEPLLFKEKVVKGFGGAAQQRLPPLFSVEAPGAGAGAARRLVVGDARQREDLLEAVRRLAHEEEWADRIQVRKRKDHFIFTIESTGAMRPEVLFKRAVAILAGKAEKLGRRMV